MTDEVYDYQQSQRERAQAAHRTPISPPRMPSEAENHLKDGVCTTIVLPNLPSVAGRVRYAMGGMNAAQFSQRCGISAAYLNQLCRGQAKTLTAYNAKRIAGASEMGVTIGWLLGMPKPEETPPEPEKPNTPVLPDLPDFWARLQWTVDHDVRSQMTIEEDGNLGKRMISEYLYHRTVPTERTRQRLADALNVPVDWLCAGLKSDRELAKERGLLSAEARKRRAETQPSAKEKAYTPVKPQILQEVQPSKPSIPQSTGTHLRFEGVYSGDTLAALVSVLKGTYRVSLTIDEVEEVKP